MDYLKSISEKIFLLLIYHQCYSIINQTETNPKDCGKFSKYIRRCFRWQTSIQMRILMPIQWKIYKQRVLYYKQNIPKANSTETEATYYTNYYILLN